MKKDFSIETSHIYTNETFSGEHKKSVDKFRRYKKTMDPDKTYSSVVLIDNYNSTEHLLDVEDFLAQLDEMGAKPDFYAYEADMRNYADDMLSIIEDSRIKKSYESYINGKNTYPCSFMTAIWYLIRLGYFTPDAGIINVRNGEKFASADYLINILPERFRSVEAQTLKLINASKGSDLSHRVDYVFFNGDS